MRCAISPKEISLYADGRCTPERESALKKHFEECSACREELARLTTLRADLKNLAPIKESEGFDFEFNRLLDERIATQHAAGWKVRLEGAFARVRDSVAYPVPVAVRVAASFIFVVAAVWGVRAQSLQKIPYIEFSAGEVQIYRQVEGGWIDPEVNMRLRQGDKIKTAEGALLNIASKGKYKARIKGNSLIVIAKLDSGLRNIDTDFSMSKGKLLVNTTKGFKGSTMDIHTPACDAEVVGTAFMLNVIDQKTWLGVLEGKVKLISKIHPLKAKDAKRIATYVAEGQKALVKSYLYPTVPELLSEKEWQAMLELYQLTQNQQIMLLIGTGPDRVESLLKGAPVYVPDAVKRAMPASIQKSIEALAEAANKKDLPLIRERAELLENLLSEYPSPSYNVEILMFIGSHYYNAHDYEDALRIFSKVATEYGDSQLASLAQCGIATIYQKDLNNLDKAKDVYQNLVEAYPNSVDAVRARESLTTIQ